MGAGRGGREGGTTKGGRRGVIRKRWGMGEGGVVPAS